MSAGTTHNYDLPAEWFDGAQEIGGLDFVDKATLINIPFLITAVSWRINRSGIRMVWCDILTLDRTEATFSDSSATSGIRVQIEELWAANHGGEEPTYTEDEIWQACRIVVRNGLRVSEYPTPGGKKGETSRSFYLAANGVRKTA